MSNDDATVSRPSPSSAGGRQAVLHRRKIRQLGFRPRRLGQQPQQAPGVEEWQRVLRLLQQRPQLVRQAHQLLRQLAVLLDQGLVRDDNRVPLALQILRYEGYKFRSFAMRSLAQYAVYGALCAPQHSCLTSGEILQSGGCSSFLLHLDPLL